MNFNHIGNHFAAGQAVIDAVRALAFAIADIGAEIARAVTSGLGDTLARGGDELIQMAASGMAVAKGAFDQNLRLGKVLWFPACAQTQRVHFRC